VFVVPNLKLGITYAHKDILEMIKKDVFKLVGCCFQRTIKSNLLNIKHLFPQQFLFDGRLKPYPTKFCEIKPLKQGQSPVGGDCYHTIINLISKIKSCFFFIPDVGAMAYPKGISVGHRPYGYLFYANNIKWCVGKRTLRVST